MERGLVERGYVVLTRILDDETLDAIEAELVLLKAEHQNERLHGIVRNGWDYVVVMNRLDKTSDLLFDIARRPQMLDAASGLLGKPAMPLHVEYFAKAPLDSTPTPPHQDHVFYYEHFANEPAVALWIALDTVTPQSGALEFDIAPDCKLKPHTRSRTLDFDYELENPQDIRFSDPIALQRGDCVAFHSFVVHRARKNSGQDERRAVVFNYRGSTYRMAISR